MGNIELESGRSWNGVGQPLMAWYPSSLMGRKEGAEWAPEEGRGLEGTGTTEEGARWVPRVGGAGDWSGQRRRRNGYRGWDWAGPGRARGEEGGVERRKVWLKGWGSG